MKWVDTVDIGPRYIIRQFFLNKQYWCGTYWWRTMSTWQSILMPLMTNMSLFHLFSRWLALQLPPCDAFHWSILDDFGRESSGFAFPTWKRRADCRCPWGNGSCIIMATHDAQQAERARETQKALLCWRKADGTNAQENGFDNSSTNFHKFCQCVGRSIWIHIQLTCMCGVIIDLPGTWAVPCSATESGRLLLVDFFRHALTALVWAKQRKRQQVKWRLCGNGHCVIVCI